MHMDPTLLLVPQSGRIHMHMDPTLWLVPQSGRIHMDKDPTLWLMVTGWEDSYAHGPYYLIDGHRVGGLICTWTLPSDWWSQGGRTHTHMDPTL